MNKPLQIDLTDKIAVVTGASGELGRVIALTLAQCGADVVLHYHKKQEPVLLLEKTIKALGRKALVVQADVADRDSIASMRQRIIGELGDPDILVTSAVGGYEWKPLMQQPAEDYASQFASTAIQNVLMAQAFVPAMIAKRWGRIVAISTECVMQHNVGQTAYVAGKRGMDGVLRGLAREIGEHQITVNQVAPGWTISERDRTNHSEAQDHYDKLVPLRHRGEDIDIANAVAFLASDLARFITGVFIPVCGGNIMPGI